MTVTLRLHVRGRVEDLLDAGDVAREGGDDHAPVERLHDLPERLAHDPLGRRVARVLRPRRVRQEADHALLAQAGEDVEVGQLAVDRGVVELEVAGVDHDARPGVRRAMPIASGMEWPIRNGIAVNGPDLPARRRAPG